MSELSFLEKLLDGADVEWKALGEVGEFQRGKRFVKEDMIESGVPCIHYGEIYTHYGLWADSARAYVREELARKLRVARSGDVVVVAAGETIEDIGNGTAWLGADDVVIHDACFSFRSPLDPKYVSYFLRTSQFKDQIKKSISSGKISSISAKGLGKAKIPIPHPGNYDRSREIQAVIVRILDSFTELTVALTTQLTSELEARKNQYTHYRDHLLTFERDDVEWHPLSEVSEVRSGWGFPKTFQGKREGRYPFYKVSDMNLPRNGAQMIEANNRVDEEAAANLGVKPAPAGTVIFPKIGAAIATNKKRILTEAAAYDNNVMGLVPNERIDPKFLFYWMQTIDLSQWANDSGAVPSIRKSKVESTIVPVPTLSEQARIVGFLDRLHMLAASLSEDLRRELNLRNQHYEYCRDLLFSFPKREAAAES